MLEDVVKAIDAVARPNGPPLSSASPIAPVTVASTSASACLTPPATVTPVIAKQPTDNNGSAAAAVVSETNSAVRPWRFPGTAAARVGAAADDIVVEGSDRTTSSAGAGTGAGPAQPSAARKDVLAAAAEVNGVGEDAAETTRLSEGVEAPTGLSAAAAAAAEPQAVGTVGAVGAEQENRGVEAVAVEQGVPPATMAEVKFLQLEMLETAWGVRCGVQGNYIWSICLRRPRNYPAQ